MGLLLVQADVVSGVYEVSDFSNGISIFSFDDFFAALPTLLPGESIGCALADPDEIALLADEYGITRIK